MRVILLSYATSASTSLQYSISCTAKAQKRKSKMLSFPVGHFASKTYILYTHPHARLSLSLFLIGWRVLLSK